MDKALLWVRYGFCTCLGLALICLAAVTATEPELEATSTHRPDTAPPA